MFTLLGYVNGGLAINVVFLISCFCFGLFYVKIIKKKGKSCVKTDKSGIEDLNIKNNVNKSKFGGIYLKIVISIVIVLIMSFVVLFAVGMFVSDDISDFNTFNNNDISFEYPSDWVHGNVKGIYLVLEGYDIVLNMNVSSTEGYSLDVITNKILLKDSKSGVEVLYENVTIVDNVKAYDIGLKINTDEEFYSRVLLFVVNNKFYAFTFNCENLEDINESFDLVKNSIKIK